jgi:hypothetical protein
MVVPRSENEGDAAREKGRWKVAIQVRSWLPPLPVDRGAQPSGYLCLTKTEKMGIRVWKALPRLAFENCW